MNNLITTAKTIKIINDIRNLFVLSHRFTPFRKINC